MRLGFFGGGCGCVDGCWWWWLWLWISGFAVSGGGGARLMKGLPLVVVELGFGEVGFEEQKRKGTWVATIFFCVVSVGGSIIFGKKWS